MSAARSRFLGGIAAVRNALTAVSTAALMSSCSGAGSGGAGRPAFERAMIEREKITAEQARCISGYVFAVYDAAQIAVIDEQGITGLPSPEWAEYGHAFMGCLFHDDGEPPPSDSPTSVP